MPGNSEKSRFRSKSKTLWPASPLRRLRSRWRHGRGHNPACYACVGRCQNKWSARRWSAPELVRRPQRLSGDGLSPRCDTRHTPLPSSPSVTLRCRPWQNVDPLKGRQWRHPQGRAQSRPAGRLAPFCSWCALLLFCSLSALASSCSDPFRKIFCSLKTVSRK